MQRETGFVLLARPPSSLGLPFPTTYCSLSLPAERNESEFARLSQLGDILGLSQVDVNSVHQGLAEQAFKEQVGPG